MLHRLLRVAKYAAIGGVIAFVGTGVLGAAASGAAWFMAPGLGMGMGVGICWAIAKVGRHVLVVRCLMCSVNGCLGGR